MKPEKKRRRLLLDTLLNNKIRLTRCRKALNHEVFDEAPHADEIRQAIRHLDAAVSHTDNALQATVNQTNQPRKTA